MNFSFFCKHCGKHLRQGDHAKCKKILKREHRTAAKTTSESSQRYLAKLAGR